MHDEIFLDVDLQCLGIHLHDHGGDVTGGNIISGDENQASVETTEKKKTRKKKS